MLNRERPSRDGHSKREYVRPSISTFDAHDLKAVLGVAQAMTSSGDGGPGTDTYPTSPAWTGRGHNTLGRR